MGHLLGEGLITKIDQITNIILTNNIIRVSINEDLHDSILTIKSKKIYAKDCGSTDYFNYFLEEIDRPFVLSDYKVDVKEVLKMVDDLNRKSFATGQKLASHSVALYSEGKLVAYASDVSRHNSVDKAIGIAASNGIRFNRTILVTTGREVASSIIKSARAGIPISVSIRGPVSSGISAAWLTGVTLISYARRSSMKIYTFPERIIRNFTRTVF